MRLLRRRHRVDYDYIARLERECEIGQSAETVLKMDDVFVETNPFGAMTITTAYESMRVTPKPNQMVHNWPTPDTLCLLRPAEAPADTEPNPVVINGLAWLLSQR